MLPSVDKLALGLAETLANSPSIVRSLLSILNCDARDGDIHDATTTISPTARARDKTAVTTITKSAVGIRSNYNSDPALSVLSKLSLQQQQQRTTEEIYDITATTTTNNTSNNGVGSYTDESKTDLQNEAIRSFDMVCSLLQSELNQSIATLINDLQNDISAGTMEMCNSTMTHSSISKCRKRVLRYMLEDSMEKALEVQPALTQDVTWISDVHDLHQAKRRCHKRHRKLKEMNDSVALSEAMVAVDMDDGDDGVSNVVSESNTTDFGGRGGRAARRRKLNGAGAVTKLLEKVTQSTRWVLASQVAGILGLPKGTKLSQVYPDIFVHSASKELRQYCVSIGVLAASLIKADIVLVDQTRDLIQNRSSPPPADAEPMDPFTLPTYLIDAIRREVSSAEL